jgi:hypothetical protein
LSCDEPKITRPIAFVHINAVKLQLGNVPPVKGNKVFKIFFAVLDPRGVNVNSAPTVVRIRGVIRVAAPVNASGDSIEQASSVGVVRYDVGIPVVVLSPLRRFIFSAFITPRSLSATEIRELGAVWWRAA